jgi:hypothetical protein
MSSRDVLDWDDLSPEDQNRAEELLKELNNMFSRYRPEKDKEVEEILPGQV